MEGGGRFWGNLMPTIKDISGAYRFFFYSFDCNEAEHVHVQREKFICKFWLNPVALSKNYGFPPKELRNIFKMVRSNLNRIEEAWNEHCG